MGLKGPTFCILGYFTIFDFDILCLALYFVHLGEQVSISDHTIIVEYDYVMFLLLLNIVMQYSYYCYIYIYSYIILLLDFLLCDSYVMSW